MPGDDGQQGRIAERRGIAGCHPADHLVTVVQSRADGLGKQGRGIGFADQVIERFQAHVQGTGRLEQVQAIPRGVFPVMDVFCQGHVHALDMGGGELEGRIAEQVGLQRLVLPGPFAHADPGGQHPGQLVFPVVLDDVHAVGGYGHRAAAVPEGIAGRHVVVVQESPVEAGVQQDDLRAGFISVQVLQDDIHRSAADGIAEGDRRIVPAFQETVRNAVGLLQLRGGFFLVLGVPHLAAEEFLGLLQVLAGHERIRIFADILGFDAAMRMQVGEIDRRVGQGGQEAFARELFVAVMDKTDLASGFLQPELLIVGAFLVDAGLQALGTVAMAAEMENFVQRFGLGLDGGRPV